MTEERVCDRIKRFYTKFESPLVGFGKYWLYLKVEGDTVHVGHYQYLQRGYGRPAVCITLNTNGGKMLNLLQSSNIWEKTEVYDKPEYSLFEFTAEFRHDHDMIGWLLEQEFKPCPDRDDYEWVVVDKSS